MIDLHLQFDETARASVLFDGATAVAWKSLEATSPFDPTLQSGELIETFVRLRAHCLDFIGQVPDRLTIYRPCDLASHVVERLDAASFAAGFHQFELVGLADIWPPLIAARGASLLIVNASRTMIEAALLAIDLDGNVTDARELSIPMAAKKLEDAIVSQLTSGSNGTVGPGANVLRELTDRYWNTPGQEWSIDAREWQLDGWSTFTLDSSDTIIDTIAAKPFRELLTQLSPGLECNQVVVVGEGAARVEALVRGLADGVMLATVPSRDILEAMLFRSRSRDLLTDSAGETAERTTATRMELAFDPRTEFGSDELEVRRDNAGVYVQMEVGRPYRLNHLPGRWHRRGFDLDIIAGDQSRRVRLFNQQPNFAAPTFSILVASRFTGAQGLVVSLLSHELGSAALVTAGGEADLSVEHFQV